MFRKALLALALITPLAFVPSFAGAQANAVSGGGFEQAQNAQFGGCYRCYRRVYRCYRRCCCYRCCY